MHKAHRLPNSTSLLKCLLLILSWLFSEYCFLKCLKQTHVSPIIDTTTAWGGGNGNPLQYSCLENPVGRGAWWAAAHRVTQSWTQLKWLSVHATAWNGFKLPISSKGIKKKNTHKRKMKCPSHIWHSIKLVKILLHIPVYPEGCIFHVSLGPWSPLALVNSVHRSFPHKSLPVDPS